MAEVIRMPRMSDTMEEGVIVGWLKEEGEEVESGETLAEVETDKATMELDSYNDGILLHIAVKKGPVPINGIIAVIGEEGEDWQAAIAAAGGGEEKTEKVEISSADATNQGDDVALALAHSAISQDDRRIKASPLARSMAKEAGINLVGVAGSGDSGRIVKRDIEAIIGGQKTVAAPRVASPLVASPPPTPEPVIKIKEVPEEKAPTSAPAVQPFVFNGSESAYEDEPVSQMRKVIARRLGESKFSAPHFYLTVEINMSKAIEARKKLNEISPVKLSFNDLVVKAAAVSLRQHPAINASWMEDKIRYNHQINVGVAVAVKDGLLVPVINHADLKSLSQINSEVKALALKAKDKKLQPQEMQGNTFTISNLGMFGIEEFTAIINPPDACIMAVGTIVEKPVVKNGEIVIGQQMKVTLSCDHRVVDGATGAQFLQTFRSILEDPIRLLV